jgi:hypothetical protein
MHRMDRPTSKGAGCGVSLSPAAVSVWLFERCCRPPPLEPERRLPVGFYWHYARQAGLVRLFAAGFAVALLGSLIPCSWAAWF